MVSVAVLRLCITNIFTHSCGVQTKHTDRVIMSFYSVR